MRLQRLSRSLAPAVVVVALLAGCGGGGDEESAGTTATTATGGGGAGAAGKAIFTSNCGSCHTLSAAGTSGNVGPNLDDLKPDKETVEDQVRSGGGGMPSFDGQLSDAQIEQVAEYVSSSAGS
jgi:mono/diheme cytochrome c family protein